MLLEARQGPLNQRDFEELASRVLADLPLARGLAGFINYQLVLRQRYDRGQDVTEILAALQSSDTLILRRRTGAVVKLFNFTGHHEAVSGWLH